MNAPAATHVEPAFDLGASGCLDFLWLALPDVMAGEIERRWIEDAAAALPPIARIGLEVRLGDGEAGADLHQRLVGSGADPVVLGRYLSREPGGPVATPALHRLLDDWASDRNGVRDDLDLLYLEWDRPGDGAAPGAPGIFFPVERPGETGQERARRRDRAVLHARAFRPETGAAVEAAIDRLLPCLGRGATLHYAGLMLGRGEALRVNVRGVRRGDVAPLLERAGWRGDREAAARHFEALVERCDRVIVAFDFTPELQPRIGFEAVLDLPPEIEPRWPALLEHLVGEGVCTPEKRDALQHFPARLHPEDEDQPWPASWLVAALSSPAQYLPWVERRVSHVKLTLEADGSLAAKAYLSVQHHWSRSPASPRASAAEGDGSAGDRLRDAAGRAVAFLVAAIGQDDLWRDFAMPGASDEWVTAFVGHALCGLEDARTREAVGRSLPALLARQRADGGWGYNALCASDADSTAWALKFLRAAAAPEVGDAAERATAFLLSHRKEDGGFSTYSATAQLRFDDRPWDGPSDGWRGNHLCVAANAAAVLPGALTHLLCSAQAADGSWPAYWWRGDAFATALAVDALAGEESAADARRRAMEWAHQQARLASSAFDRASLARILMGGDDGDLEAARTIVAALAAEQSADGAWGAGAALLLPHPSQPHPEETLRPYLDVRRIFTTAAVLSAIAGVRSRSR
jgi:hypothetical protein